MYQIKIRRIGNSLGIILPQTLLAKLATEEGDSLVVSGGPQSYSVRPAGARSERVLNAFEEGRSRYHDLMRELAYED